MRLFEVKGNVVTININTDAIRKFNTKKQKSKLDCGDYNEFLIEKLNKGNKDAIVKSIDIIENILIGSGCNTYEQLFKRESN